MWGNRECLIVVIVIASRRFQSDCDKVLQRRDCETWAVRNPEPLRIPEPLHIPCLNKPSILLIPRSHNREHRIVEPRATNHFQLLALPRTKHMEYVVISADVVQPEFCVERVQSQQVLCDTPRQMP
jgi:hypothetical protein